MPLHPTRALSAGLVAAVVSSGGAATAQSAALCTPCQAPVEETAPPEPKLSKSAVITVVAGFVFEGVAQAITAAHVASGGTPSRIYDFVPVAGPIGVAARDPVGTNWGTALVFAACAQAVGALTLVLGIRDLYSPWGDVRIGVSVVPTAGALGVSGHF